MSGHVLMIDVDGERYTPSALSTCDDARSFACDLLRVGTLKIIEIWNDRA